jgi:anaerobic magnesium-protoporphyrin IX monomethyl ester cyclase
MATIVFVSLYDRNAHGQRLMSANLKRHGHTCHIIFLKRYDSTPQPLGAREPGEFAWIGIDRRGREFKYASNSPIDPAELQLLRRVIERIKPDLIGLTVNTPLRAQNARVTRFIKSFCHAPVVWGGFDPTTDTGDCLDFCDYACVGEGDTTILELAECVDRGQGFDGVHNLAYQRDGQAVFTERAPLVQDLDSLPWRDNNPENKYFIEDGRLTENYPVLNDGPPGTYQCMTSRGCPYRCSYCCEATLKDLYTGERFLRRRSPADCVAELAAAKARFGLKEIAFEDEIFGMDVKWLSEFAPLYRARVALPFSAYIYPTRNSEVTLSLLQFAGLNYCCLSLESGSEKINRQVFNRVYDRGLFLTAVQLVKDLEIDFYTDIITYNPYEDEKDLNDTLDVLLAMRGRFHLCVNRLYVLPGTQLWEMMARDGVKPDDQSRDRLFNFYSRLYWIVSFAPHAGGVVRWLRRSRLFRRYPALMPLGFLEWLLDGPPGKVVDAVLRPRPLEAEKPRTPWRRRIRQLLEPPAPVMMNKAEQRYFRLGRWNLYLGGRGRSVRDFVSVDTCPGGDVDIAADAASLPFPAGLFQRVECDAVLEHVREPALVMREIERVLAPGGYAHLVAGFCHPFQQTAGDYHRFTLEGLKQMAGGLEVVAEGWRTGPTATLLVVLLEYIKMLLPWRWWRVVAHGVFGWLLFPLRYVDLLLLRSRHLDRIGNHCYLWLRKPYDKPAVVALGRPWTRPERQDGDRLHEAVRVTSR